MDALTEDGRVVSMDQEDDERKSQIHDLEQKRIAVIEKMRALDRALVRDNEITV